MKRVVAFERLRPLHKMLRCACAQVACVKYGVQINTSLEAVAGDMYDRKVETEIAGFVTFFRNKFQGIFQDSNWFFQDSKFQLKPFHFQSSLRSTYIFYNFNSENLIASVKQIFGTFPRPLIFF